MLSGMLMTGAVMVAGACEGPFTMGDSHIGPVRLGMSVAEVTAMPGVKRTSRNEEGDYYPLYTVAICPGVEVEALSHDGDRTIDYIDTYSSDFLTPQGAYVGMTVAQLKRVYPRGRLQYGMADGFYASFLSGTGVYFRIRTEGIPKTCFTDIHADCDARFEQVRSESADIRR